MNILNIHYFCEFHDEWINDSEHRYCFENGLVSRWEILDRGRNHDRGQLQGGAGSGKSGVAASRW